MRQAPGQLRPGQGRLHLPQRTGRLTLLTISVAGVEDWREMMVFWLVWLHPLCLKALDRYEVVGVNAHRLRHFSGNFWWATAELLRRLPSPDPNGGRLSGEFWLGRVP
eukprot:RCo040776